MEVKEIEINKLVPYWHNPRKNDKTIERLVKSIQEYGFNSPIVVNKDFVLITGHARLKAAKKLGMQTVPTVVLNLTDEQAKKYRIADNKIQELTEWDEDALFKELREIGDKFEILDIGFSFDDVREILGEQEEALKATLQPQPTVEYTSVAATPVQTEKFIVPETQTKSDIEAKLKQREAELNNRFVKESYEQTKYQNLVSCPHCGHQFKVRGIKND